MLRPFSGSDCTVLPEMTSPTVGVSVCRIGETPTTWTVSCKAPTLNLKSSLAICLASSANTGVVAVRKPEIAALTR